MRVESQNRIVGAHTEAQALANASSMKVTIPQAFWAELKRQNLIEKNAPGSWKAEPSRHREFHRQLGLGFYANHGRWLVSTEKQQSRLLVNSLLVQPYHRTKSNS